MWKFSDSTLKKTSLKILSAIAAAAFTITTLATAAALNSRSSSKNRPHIASVITTAPAQKEKPKARRKVIKKKKELKNIKQAPRVSPNITITLDIPLELPEVQSMQAELLATPLEVSPPVPNAANPQPEYPLEARREGIQGRVVASALVDEYGYVLKVRITSSEPADVFDTAVTTALRYWRFTPAMARGEPTSQWVQIPFNFLM